MKLRRLIQARKEKADGDEGGGGEELPKLRRHPLQSSPLSPPRLHGVSAFSRRFDAHPNKFTLRLDSASPLQIILRHFPLEISLFSDFSDLMRISAPGLNFELFILASFPIQFQLCCLRRNLKDTSTYFTSFLFFNKISISDQQERVD